MIKATMRFGSPNKGKDSGGTGSTNITNVSATANTLAPGSSATASATLSADSLSFVFGIPEGDEGQQGPQGAQGIQGPQGEQGPQGVQGETGAQGPAGSAATIAVGTVTTGAAGTNASVTNSGTPSAAVFDFVIPRGADGSGSGDMLKSTYDTDNDGYVDAVEDQEDPGNGIEFSLDANGKGQYRAVGAPTWIPFLSGGGPTYTRLWTNPSPAANFAAQTVTLSETLENYDAVRIVWDRWYNGGVTEANWETNPNAIAYIYDLRNKENIINSAQHVQMGALSNESSYVYGRRCYFPSAWTFNQIVFATGMRLNNANTSTSALIPVFIDGVKY